MSEGFITATVGPSFTGSEPSVALVSVTGSEATGGRYQDANQGLHAILEITPVAATAQRPLNVSLWLDFDDSNGWIYQGVWKLTTVGQIIRIGDPNLSSEGIPGSGVIWVPYPGHTSWKVAAISGTVQETATPPTGFVQDAFTVAAASACPSSDVTNAHFVPNPDTGEILQYVLYGLGDYHWNFYEIDWTQPSLSTDSSYWFSFITVQKGYEDAGGQWHPAPDDEGRDDDRDIYKGRWITDSGAVQGGISVAGTTVVLRGDIPPNWAFPPAKNLDGTPNLYRTFRFWIYAVSRLGTDPTGGTGTIILQTTCWPGSRDHFDVTPAEQPPALDAGRINPITLGHALDVVAGVMDIVGKGIVADDIDDAALIARHFGLTIEPVGLINIAPDGNGEIITTKTQETVYNQNDKKLYYWNGTDRYVRRITNSDFVSGIKAVERVTSLPVSFTNYPQGTVVYLTTDDKLYRSTGSAWTKAVDGGDISAHTVTANQIAALTITASEIAANSIIAGKINTDAVTAGCIAAGAIRASDAVFELAAIKSADIESLVASKITAGTISASISMTAPDINITGTPAIRIKSGEVTITGASNTAELSNGYLQITGSGAFAGYQALYSSQICWVSDPSGNIFGATGAYLSLYIASFGGNIFKCSSSAGVTRFNIRALSAYANNAAAVAGGLSAGDLYLVASSDPRVVAIVY